MLRITGLRSTLLLGLVWALLTGPAQAAPCGGDFGAWLEGFKREAASKGISPRTIHSALNGISRSPRVVSLDRNQRVFKQSFEQFAANRVTPARLRKAAGVMQRHSSMLNRIEQQFGVPREVIVAIWGLETDFGGNMGKHPAIPALATLAHDCRRSEFFRNQLMAALQIIERGDLSVAEMRGAWAGELGQTQFMPTSYVNFAIDFDGSGRRDLIRSVPDALASTANYLRGHGWRPGEPWTEGTQNFRVLREWNRAAVYQRTIALFASRLAEPSRDGRQRLAR